MYGDSDYQNQGNPHNEPEGECAYCGCPTDDTYCTRACYVADIY